MKVKSNSSASNGSFKLYTGVANCYVRGVNFNKAQMEEFFGREIAEEPVYVTTEPDGTKTAVIRFFVETVPGYKDNEGNDITLKSSVRLTLRNAFRVGSNSGKVQVIDAYGRTAWGLPSVVENHQPIMYENGHARISDTYKKALVGEEDLIKFLIAYLNVKPTNKWDNTNKVYVDKTGAELEECEIVLESLQNYFNGDFSELQSALMLQPENEVKLVFGVRNSNDRQIQTIYNREFWKSNAKTASIEKEIATFVSNSSSDTVYDTQDLHEYVVKATDVSNPANVIADDPLSNSASATETPWGF